MDASNERIVLHKLRIKTIEVINLYATNKHYEYLFNEVITLHDLKFKIPSTFLGQLKTYFNNRRTAYELDIAINYVQNLTVEFMEFFVDIIECDYKHVHKLLDVSPL